MRMCNFVLQKDKHAHKARRSKSREDHNDLLISTNNADDVTAAEPTPEVVEAEAVLPPADATDKVWSHKIIWGIILEIERFVCIFTCSKKIWSSGWVRVLFLPLRQQALKTRSTEPETVNSTRRPQKSTTTRSVVLTVHHLATERAWEWAIIDF